MPRYPDIYVPLVREDGNAFSILGRVRVALRQGGVPKAEIDQFFTEATSGDYSHLLETVQAWVASDGSTREDEDE